ncbi:MAG: MSMEG_0570 family nitrogen starvation response protein [Planctomycetota bacterium]
MPETSLNVRWPDETERSYYSPSTVVHRYFPVGEAYALAEFLETSRSAYQEASDRVKAKYGMACSGAAAALARIETDASRFSVDDDGKVVIRP